MVRIVPLACLLIAAPGLAVAETFEGPAPLLVAPGATVVGDPIDPANHCLRLEPATAVYAEGLRLPAEFSLTVRCLLAEDRGECEAPVIVCASDDGSRFVQVYLEGRSSAVRVVAATGGVWQPLGQALAPRRVRLGEWHTLEIVCAGGRLAAGLDGEPLLCATNPIADPGRLGLRVGRAVTLYDDLSVREVGDSMSRYDSMSAQGQPEPLRLSAEVHGRTVTIESADRAQPLEPFGVVVRGGKGRGHVALLDTGGRTIDRKKVDLSAGSIELLPAGTTGPMTLTLTVGDHEVARATVLLQPQPRFRTDRGHERLFDTLVSQVKGDESFYWWKDGRIRANPTWVRDHVHEMKAYKWWAEDLTSFIDTLIELQPARGFFHEILTVPTDSHTTFVHPEFVRIEPGDSLAFVRLELEADVEYLMVEGVYTAWQATGDDAAMERRLAALEAGMQFCLEDPMRWDAEHQLMKRPLTPDTWDFTFGLSDQDRTVSDYTPMAIMHGDQSGLYQACVQLAKMHRALGHEERAEEWQRQGEAIRARANALLWTGDHYLHQLYLQPVDTRVDESQILSLSNTYDINRGMPTHEMAVRIIDAYHSRKASAQFAEWYALDPPYPQFGPYPAGAYINGGVAGFVAGELAKAALAHGREAYGADIIDRVAQLVAERGMLGFLYTRDGQDQGGGPSGWSAAAVLSAMAEGLAGIVDDATEYEDITVAPRFAAAGVSEATVCLPYGPSKAYVALQYSAGPDAIDLTVAGNARHIHLDALLPDGRELSRVEVDGERVGAAVRPIEGSRYAQADVDARPPVTHIRVTLKP